MDEVAEFAKRIDRFAKPTEPPQRQEPTIAELLHLFESLEEGIKLAAIVIAELDVRVRKLEIAERKRERKLLILKEPSL